MTRLDDKTLMAWIDGELPPEEAARVQAFVSGSPPLARRAESLRRLNNLARDAFPCVADPRDRALAARISRARQSAGWVARVGAALPKFTLPQRTVVWTGLVTAAFVGGVLLASGLDDGPDNFLMAPGGNIVDGALLRVLDTRLAAQGPDAEGHSVGLTFQDQDARWCRTFEARASGLAGLACRSGQEWQIVVLAPAPLTSPEMRQAGSTLPGPVLDAVDVLLRDETLAPPDEKAARDAGWPQDPPR